jgi:predicted TIM-barrel fold metal-dependent hydrolase
MDPLIIVSADGHASMPPKLWSEYLESKYHYLLPQLVAENRLYNDTMQLLNDGALPPDQADAWDPEHHHRSGGWKGLWDLDVRLAQMDREGTAAEFVFHGDFRTADLFNNIMNGIYPPDAMDAGMRAYDRWVYDAFGSAKDRLLLTSSNASGTNVQAMLDELDWIAERGFIGTYAPAWAAVEGVPPLHDEYWDPVWAKYEDTGMVSVVHGGFGIEAGWSFKVMADAWSRTKAQGGSDMDLLMDLSQVFNEDFFTDLRCRQAMCQLLLGGVFDRHPDFKVMFTEFRADWLPATLEYADKLFAEQRDSVPAKRPPSETWKAHCMTGLSFMHQAEVEHRHEIGIDNIDFGRDYPHTESTWPCTKDYLKLLFAGVPQEDVRKILGENAIRFLGLDRAHLEQVAARISFDIDEITAPDAADSVSQELVELFAVRCGVLKPWEGAQRLEAVGKLVEGDFAPVGA